MASNRTHVSSRKGRPNYPLEFKRSLAAAACNPGRSASKLAREHGVNANLLFKWRQQYRAGRLGPLLEDQAVLLPVAVSPRIDVPTTATTKAVDAWTGKSKIEVRPSPVDACIEIDIAGLVVRVRGPVNVVQLATVLHCISRKS